MPDESTQEANMPDEPTQEAMPEIIEPMIGPVTVKDVNAIMKNKQIEGSVDQAKFLQFGMPQLRLPLGRMSNPEIQKIMHNLRKNAKQKPNIAERRRAKMEKAKAIADLTTAGGDPDFDWAALQRLRKSGEGLY